MLTLEPTSMTLAATEHVERLHREAAHQHIARLARAQTSTATDAPARSPHDVTRERGTLDLRAGSFWKRWAV